MTIDVPPDLHKKLRVMAALRDKNLAETAVEVLGEYMDQALEEENYELIPIPLKKRPLSNVKRSE
jgi:hypothetical protein